MSIIFSSNSFHDKYNKRIKNLWEATNILWYGDVIDIYVFIHLYLWKSVLNHSKMAFKIVIFRLFIWYVKEDDDFLQGFSFISVL